MESNNQVDPNGLLPYVGDGRVAAPTAASCFNAILMNIKQSYTDMLWSRFKVLRKTGVGKSPGQCIKHCEFVKISASNNVRDLILCLLESLTSFFFLPLVHYRPYFSYISTSVVETGDQNRNFNPTVDNGGNTHADSMASGVCPHDCGYGYCTEPNSWCTCHTGYTGPSCRTPTPSTSRSYGDKG
ncbi:unnamed protein product, partial [Meganyctiphanes norvegica]